MKRILGIDPGLAETGYGIIEVEGNRCRHVAHGVIRTPSSSPPGERLLHLYKSVENIIKTYGPEEAGIENLYFTKNIGSALPVAQARGVVLLVLAKRGITAGEYTPQAIKQAIVGTGRADKGQVQEFLRILLALKTVPKPDHAADAIASAVCHFHTLSSMSYKRRS